MLISGANYHLKEVGYDKLRSEYQDKTLEGLNIQSTTGVTVVGVKDNVKGLINTPCCASCSSMVCWHILPVQ